MEQSLNAACRPRTALTAGTFTSVSNQKSFREVGDTPRRREEMVRLARDLLPQPGHRSWVTTDVPHG
ncbi:hypothetical protein GN956_G25900 [Arapaima gigas]